jgi:hypothetical protein
VDVDQVNGEVVPWRKKKYGMRYRASTLSVVLAGDTFCGFISLASSTGLGKEKEEEDRCGN